MIFNTSPSASLTGGYGAELPEPIDYFNNTMRFMVEQRRGALGGAAGIYRIVISRTIPGRLVFDNPFRTTDCVAPNGCTNATQGPATGRVDLYPDNHAHYINFAGSFALLQASPPAGQHQCRMAAAERCFRSLHHQ